MKCSPIPRCSGVCTGFDSERRMPLFASIIHYKEIHSVSSHVLVHASASGYWRYRFRIFNGASHRGQRSCDSCVCGTGLALFVCIHDHGLFFHSAAVSSASVAVFVYASILTRLSICNIEAFPWLIYKRKRCAITRTTSS